MLLRTCSILRYPKSVRVQLRRDLLFTGPNLTILFPKNRLVLLYHVHNLLLQDPTFQAWRWTWSRQYCWSHAASKASPHPKFYRLKRFLPWHRINDLMIRMESSVLCKGESTVPILGQLSASFSKGFYSWILRCSVFVVGGSQKYLLYSVELFSRLPFISINSQGN